MTLTRNGETISLDNENHAEAFIGAGWTEVKTSVPAANVADAEGEEKPVKKATTRKNRRGV